MTVFPTAYFGNIAYYRALAIADNPVIECHEHFVKQTLRSRCEILGPNDIQRLTIPVVKPNGSKTAMTDLQIADDNWQKLHWKSIETAYGSSAYFDYYGCEVEKLIFSSETNLIQFNKAIHERICSWLDLGIKVDYSTNYIDIQQDDINFRKEEFIHLTEFKPYHQVFRTKEECIPNLSVLDLVFNLGPMARNWIL